MRHAVSIPEESSPNSSSSRYQQTRKPTSERTFCMKLDSKRNVFLFVLSALVLVTAVLNWPRVEPSAGAASPVSGVEPQDDSLDTIVRSDFFAGMMGNRARLDRGMKYCEDLLAKNPKHAEAWVCRGGGSLVHAGH